MAGGQTDWRSDRLEVRQLMTGGQTADEWRSDRLEVRQTGGQRADDWRSEVRQTGGQTADGWRSDRLEVRGLMTGCQRADDSEVCSVGLHSLVGG